MTFDKKVRDAAREIERNVGKVLDGIGTDMAADIQVSMTAGRFETQDPAKHVPSQPGEPPAVVTRDLRNSIEWQRTALNKVEVSANDPKAYLLEFGTSKMAERPFMRPARNRMEPEASKRIAEAVTAALRKTMSR